MANMLKREKQKRKRGGTANVRPRVSLGKKLVSAMLVLTMSTMSYSPAIAVAANSASNTSASATATTDNSSSALSTQANDSSQSAPAVTSTTSNDNAAAQAATQTSATSENSPAAPAAQNPIDQDATNGDGSEGGQDSSERSASSSSRDSADASDASADAEDADADAEDADADDEDANSEDAEDPDAQDNSDESASSDAASKESADGTKTLQRTLKSTAGGKYVVKVSYDAAAAIPDGSKLEIVEYVQEPSDPNWRSKPENKGRPYDTEKIVSKSYLDQRTKVAATGLGSNEYDYVFFSKFINLAIKHDGKTIQPKANVEVIIETNAVDVSCADGIWLADMVYSKGLASDAQAKKDGRVTNDGKVANAIAVKNTTYSKDKSGKTGVSSKMVRLQYVTNEFGELALTGIAVPKATLWEDENSIGQVLAADVQSVTAHETSADGLASNEELLGAYTFGNAPSRSRGTMLWARIVGPDGKSAVENQGKLSGYLLQGGAPAGGATQLGTPDSVLRFKADEGIVLTKEKQAKADAEKAQDAQDAQDAAASDADQSSQSEPRTLSQGVTAFDGNTYSVAVTYGIDAGIPEGATLQVRELSGAEYELYLARTQQALGDDALLGVRAFDITILDADGNEIEPKAPVQTNINLVGPPMLKGARVVHFGEGSPDVSYPQVKSSAGGTSLDFTAESFSVFVVAMTMQEKTLTASDGNDYVIKVTYDNSAGIPGDAELAVAEVKEGDAGYEGYIANSVEKLGQPMEDVVFARAFDIKLVNPENGQEYQPATDVKVSVELLNEDVGGFGTMDVVHFPGAADDRSEALPSSLNGDALEFKTSGFSTYVVVSTSPVRPVQGSPETSGIQEHVGYYLSNGDNNNLRYMVNEVYNDANPNGLKKINSIFPSDADLFYFEKAEGNNQYYLYTYVDGQQNYLYFKYVDNNNGSLMITPNVAERKPFTVNVSNQANGQYTISGSDNGKTWYINQHGDAPGQRFAGWYQNNNGSKIRLTRVEKDPFNIDGKEYAIVASSNLVALKDETAVVASGVQGLGFTKVTQNSNGTYSAAGDAVALAMWLFEAQEGGGYYLSASTGGTKQYLNIAPASSNNVGSNVTLSSTPQKLNVAMNTAGTMLIISVHTTQTTWRHLTLLDFFGGNNNPNRFSAWTKQNLSDAAANEMFVLGEPAPGTIAYQFEKPPASSTDPLDRIYHDQFAHDDWSAGYKTRSYTLNSYGPTQLFTYTVDHWVDEDGNVYGVDEEIASAPEGVLKLYPEWGQPQVTNREVLVEYYNYKHSTTTPAESMTVVLTDNPMHSVLSMVNNFYSQSEGKRYQFTGEWLTDSGVAVGTNADPIDLRDFQYYKEGDFSHVKMVAQWETKVDPWGIDGQSFVMVNDRFDNDGYTADTRYLAPLPQVSTNGNVTGLDRSVVLYDPNENTCTSTDIMPGVWKFMAQDDGTYTIQDINGKYLSVNSERNVTVSDSPQKVEVLYSYDRNRYIFKVASSSTTTLAFDNGKQLFTAYNRNYATTSKDDKTGRNSQFILAPLKSSVVYSYPEYSGSYGSEQAPPAEGTTTNLPEALIEDWEQGYKVKPPSQNTYQAANGSYIWNYEFDHWEKNDSTSARVEINSTIATEPKPALGLKAIWRFVNKTYAPVNVKYTVQRQNTANNNDEKLSSGTKLPGVNGLVMVPGSGAVDSRSYWGQETVENASVGSYEVKDLEGNYYTTVNGKKYRFDGWRVGGSDANVQIAAGQTVNLVDYDTNHDLNVELLSVWTENYKDPWGIDGKSYLIVNDNGNAHYAMSATPTTNTTGLTRYDVTKPDGSVPLYTTSSSPYVMWKFEALEDGSYIISTTSDGHTQYLHADAAPNNRASGSLGLQDNVSDATHFRLYGFNGSYAIGYKVDGNNFKTLFDRQNDGIRVYNNDGTPGNNARFVLGLPTDQPSVIYRYPLYSGSWGSDPADTGTTNNLTSLLTADLWESGYKAIDPAQDSYYSRNDFYEWKYSFNTWKDGDNSIAPDDTVTQPSAGSPRNLYANWTYEGVQPIERTVHYVFAFQGTPISEPGLINLAIENNVQIVSGEDATIHYEVSGVDPGFYKTTDGHVYEFAGWKDEAGNTFDPQEIDLTQSRYDPDGDDVITLTAQWNNTYAGYPGKLKPTREVRFFVSVHALSADAFNDEASISTESAHFTDAIHHSIMLPGDIECPPHTYDPNLGQEVYAITNYYQGATDINIAQADKEIRQLAMGGVEREINGNSVLFQLMDFPSDAEVLEALKHLPSNKSLTLDGKKVDPKEINEQNFTIRWYVCKLQNDRWHIDGKLTPNLSFLKVEKTFAGDEAAINNILHSNFTINVSNATQNEAGIISSDKLMDLSLVLNDQTANREKYGLFDGDATNGTYGYIEKHGDTYVWLIPVARGGEYDITEKNYTPTIPGKNYGLAAQFSVTSADDVDDALERQPWFGTISGDYAATYPRTSIDVSNTTDNIKSVNLYNTYVETDSFVIQKIDTGVDGRQDIAMPGVEFKVTQLGENGVRTTPKITQVTPGVDGRYVVDLFGGGGTSDIVKTGADGNIYLKMARPEGSEVSADDDTRYRFEFQERVPQGYLERTDGKAPQFVMSMNVHGEFQVDDTSSTFVEPAGGHISLLKAGLPGGSEQEATVVGATITNKPKEVSLLARKAWDSVHRQSYVTVQLNRRLGQRTQALDQQRLDATMEEDEPSAGAGADKKWVYTWDHLPMMVGNKKADYTITETTVGPYAAGTETFKNNWGQEYEYTYLDANNQPHNDYTTTQIIADLTNTNSSYICKVTDGSGELLYYMSASGKYHAAVYTSIKDAFYDVNNNLLLTKSNTAYAGTDYQVQMLVNYRVPADDYIQLDKGRSVIFSTALTPASSAYVEDGYPFKDTGTRATLTRVPQSSRAFATVEGQAGYETGFGFNNVTIDGGGVQLTEVNGAALTAQNATVTIENATIRNFQAENGGAVYVNGESLSISNSLLTGCSATNGGAVYAGGGAVNITNATITGCSAQNGGALYVQANNSNPSVATLAAGNGGNPTITNNSATGAGAGIYLADGATLNISGAPNFGGTDTDAEGNVLGVNGNFTDDEFTGAKNGAKDYAKARQDIFIAEKHEDAPESIVVNGDLTGAAGSIWVWADQSVHYETLMPFARFDSSLSSNSYNAAHLGVFRNARADGETGNTTGTYLFGETGSDPSLIYWSGVKGRSKVILSKVDRSTGTSLAGAQFRLYRGQSATAYTPDLLTSQANGTLFIGDLIYGDDRTSQVYLLEETRAPNGYSASAPWFYLIVNKNGTVISNGYASREAAWQAALAYTA